MFDDMFDKRLSVGSIFNFDRFAKKLTKEEIVQREQKIFKEKLKPFQTDLDNPLDIMREEKLNNEEVPQPQYNSKFESQLKDLFPIIQSFSKNNSFKDNFQESIKQKMSHDSEEIIEHEVFSLIGENFRTTSRESEFICNCCLMYRNEKDCSGYKDKSIIICEKCWKGMNETEKEKLDNKNFRIEKNCIFRCTGEKCKKIFHNVISFDSTINKNIKLCFNCADKIFDFEFNKVNF